jgi:hypothetical protein
MPFELEDFTAAKLLDHQTLSDKDREADANPGVSLFFEMTIANSMLTMFDGSLRSMLYTKSAASVPPKQGKLEGIPEGITDMPNLTNIAAHVKRLVWHETFQGLRLSIDYGMGGVSNLELIDCKAQAFRFQPKEGGSLLMKFKVEAPDVPEVVHGKLPKLKSTEVKIRLVQPDPVQQDIEQKTPPPRSEGAAPLTPEQALAKSFQDAETT